MSGVSMSSLFVVQEYMSGGSIDRRLWNPEPQPLSSLSELERLVWACDISEGMAFIHQKGFTHRDLKSQNVLYDHNTMRAKVADFGMSRAMSADLRPTLLRSIGTAPMANADTAPETRLLKK